MSNLFGIDISEFSQSIDLSTLRGAGVEFIYMRVNDGTGHLDHYYYQYRKQCRAAGMIMGSYIFFRPDEDVQTQIHKFAINYDVEAGDLPPCLDVEEVTSWGLHAYADRARIVASALREIETMTGVEPIIYCSPSFWDERMHNVDDFYSLAGPAHGKSRFSEYRLWLADYSLCRVPSPWKYCYMHQYAGDRNMRGIDGNVDLNHFPGTREDLVATCVKSVPNLTIGRVGQRVVLVQQRLNQMIGVNTSIPALARLAKLDEDGVLGPNTMNAYRIYAESSNIAFNNSISITKPFA